MPGGVEPPSNQGAGSGRLLLSKANETERIIPRGTETTSVVIRAHPDNSDIIYVGFGENTDVNDGFPLNSGDGLTFDLDVNQESLYAVSNSSGDEIRWIALE